MKLNLLKRFSLLLSALAIGLNLQAQVTTASINGVIKSGNEPLIGATIRATHQPTGTVYGATTLPNGRYIMSGMRIGGPYILQVSYIGYTTEVITNIQLSLGDERSMNFNLKEATSELQEVTVVGTSNPSQSSSRTGAEEFITRDRMDKMPTINRSLNDFTKLTPMSSGSNFGGTSYRFNNVTVDGASFNNSFGLSSSLGASGTEPISLEALEQVQVMIAPFDVRNGAFTGAAINSVTKSGTNDFQASAYMYTKSPSMMGYRQNDDIIPVTEFTNRQFGVSLGGALIKNKLFFYVNGELDRQEKPVNFRPRANKNAPVSGNNSAADAESLQDLSNFLGQNFDYNPGDYIVTKTPTYADRITARLDYNINSKNALSVKYFYLKSFNTNVPSTSGAQYSSGRGPNAFAIPFSSSYYRTNNNFNIFMADLNTTINNTMSNTLKVGYSALRDFREMDGGYFPEVEIGDGNGNSFTTFGTEANSYNNRLNSDIFQIQDNFLWNVGNHQLTFGTQSDYRSFLNGYARDFAGSWKFASIDDFKSDVLAFKNNTPGYVSKADKYTQAYSLLDNGEFPYARVDVLSLGFYVQDKWAVTPSLNLTYGLRVDVPIFMNKLMRNEAIEGIEFQGGRTIDVSKFPKTAPLLSPRIGFNWDAVGHRRLIIRGGTGIFSGTPPYVWLSNQAGNNGLLFGKVSETKSINATDPSKSKYISHPFDGVSMLPKPSGSQIPSAGIAVSDPNFKYPQLWKSNLAVDYKFGDGWIATVEVLYNKDMNAIYHSNIALPDYDSADAGMMEGADNRPYFKKKTTNDKVTDVILMSNTSKGYSIYSSFQLQKNFTQGTLKGLYLNGSFSFGEAKSVTDGSSSVAFSSWQYRAAVDPNSQELGFSQGSFPNRLLIQASYKKDWSRFYSTSFGVVYQRYSPFRYSYAYNGDLNGDGSNANDLIFVPASKDQITLVPENASDRRTPDELWNQLDAFINQDSYLKTRRGQYAERNGAVAPYANQIDVNITHDINLPLKNGKINTLRFSFDIVNFANLLNKNWGVQSTTILGNQQYQFLKVQKNAVVSNGKPEFTMPLVNKEPLANTFKDYVSSSSRWQMQFGIKYLFN